MRRLVLACAICALVAGACVGFGVTSLDNTGGAVPINDGDPYDASQSSPYGTGGCIFSVTTTTPGRVQQAHVTRWSLNNNADHLLFFDGPTTASPLISTVRYGGGDGYIVSTGPAMTVQLVTDAFEPKYGGYLMNVTAIAPVQHCTPMTVIQSSDFGGATLFQEPVTNFGAAQYMRSGSCSWLVNLDPGYQTLELRFYAVVSTLLPGDAVIIYAGPNDSSPIDTILGNRVVNGDIQLYLTQPSTLIKFVTQGGDKFGAAGIQFRVAQHVEATHCSGTRYINVTNSEARYSEPGVGVYVGVNYDSGLDCWWVLTAPPGQSTAVKFDQINLKYGADAIIYDGPTATSPVLSRASGPSYAGSYRVGSSEVVAVHFVSAPGMPVGDGFNFYVLSMQRQVQCPTIDTTPDEGRFGAPFPSYNTMPYPPNYSCSFTFIKPPTYERISLEVTNVYLNLGSTLNIITYDATNTPTLFLSLNSTSIPVGPYRYNLAVSRADVVFTAGPNIGTGSGFDGYYGYINMLPPCSGVSYLNGGDALRIFPGVHNLQRQLYATPLNCTWVLQAPTGFTAFLNLFNFDLRPGDRLTMFDGSMTGRLLGNLTGRIVSSQYFAASSQQMWVNFQTAPGPAVNTSYWGIDASVTSVNNYTPDVICPNQGTINMNAYSGGVDVCSGICDQANVHAREMRCQWRFTRTDYVTGVGMEMQMYYGFMFPGDSLYIYDGVDTSTAPVMYFHNETFQSEFFNYYAPIRSYGPDITIVYVAGSYGNGQFSLTVSPSIPYSPDDQYINGICPPYSYLLADENWKQLSPASSAGVAMRSDMFCGWLIDMGTASTAKIEVGQDYINDDPTTTTLWPNLMTWRVYDGPNNSSPLLLTPSSPYYRYSSGRYVWVEFNTSSAQMLPSLGFYLSWRRASVSVPCSGHLQTDMTSTLYVADYSGWDGSLNYPASRTCTWGFSSVPGSIYVWGERFNFIEGAATVTVYDGVDTTAPVIYYMDKSVSGVGWGKTTGAAMYVVYATNGPAIGTGFQFRVDNTFPTVPCSGFTTWPFLSIGSNYFFGTGQQLRRPDAYQFPGVVDHRQIFPQPANSDCSFAMLIPYGMVSDIFVEMGTADGSIEVRNNGNPILLNHGMVTSGWVRGLCGNITVRVLTGDGFGNTTWWRVGVTGYQDGPSIRSLCLRSDDIPCAQVASAANNFELAPFLNCTSLYNVYMSQHDIYNLPRLRYVRDITATSWLPLSDLTVRIPGWLNFPNLETAINMDMRFSPFLPTNWTKLVYVQTLNMQESEVPQVNFPALTVTEFFYAVAMPTLISFSFPVLQTVTIMQINSNSFLLRAPMPALQHIGIVLCLESNARLKVAEFPSLTDFVQMSITQTQQSSFALPAINDNSLNRGFLSLGTMANLATIDLSNTSVLAGMTLTQLGQLFHLELPRMVSFAYHMELFGVRLATISAPVLQKLSTLTVSQSTSTMALDLPNLYYAKSVTVSDGSFVTVSLPGLQTVVNQMTFATNFQLSVLDFCNLTHVGNATITQCPGVSCQEAQKLFTAADAASIQASSPDCNPTLLGSFGCAEGVVRTVDTRTCGFTVACIQYEISASYRDKGSQVLIPAGTYTGCSAPLNPLGKLITVSGSTGNNGATVIDCQGVGRALIIESGETSRLTFKNIIFRNGQATSGGLASIGAASPTFIAISFLTSSASVNGGAMVIAAGGAPTLIGCSLSGNQAGAAGGAIAVIGGTLTATNVTFSANTAALSGGAISFKAASAMPRLDGVTCLDNVAEQGGAVFVDGSLWVRGATMRRNIGAQFGGAIASVPARPAVGISTNISSSLFSANTAGCGGALYGFSANYFIESTRLELNQADGDGGGLQALCSPSYRILQGVLGTCPGVVSFTGCDLVSNKAGGNGGGVAISELRLSTSGGSMSTNAATTGAAVYAPASLVSMTGTVLTGNHASQTGGGIYCEPFAGSCAVAGMTFSSNTADVAGGGAYLCTSSCPNTTTLTGTLSIGTLPPISSANTFSANAVGASGYGADVATGPESMSWVQTPLTSVASGRALTAGGSLIVAVRDAFNAPVTSSNALLAVTLSVAYANGTATRDVKVGGASTALILGGQAVFSSASLQADLSLLNADYILRATLSSGLGISAPVHLLPCAPGTGRSVAAAAAGGPYVCADCQPGYSSDSNYVCVPCQPGSVAAASLATSCVTCPVNTRAAQAAASVCEPCPAGYIAPQVGSADCVADPESSALSGGLSSGAKGGIAGASIFVVIAVVVGALVLWRLARRKTMQKYYLDSDSTIRASGIEETPLMKAVRKIIGAASTTRCGGGMFADVYKAKYEGRWIALKVIKKELISNIEAQGEFRREAVALSRLSEVKHRGIVELIFFLERNPMCVAMNFCSNGTLKRLLETKHISVAEKTRLAAEIAAAMVVVHAQSVVHLDLKTDNILLDDDNHIQLADFGISRILGMNMDALFALHAAASMKDGGGSGSMSRAGGPGSMGSLGSFPGMSVPGPPPPPGVAPRDLGIGAAFTPQYVDPLRLIVPTTEHDDDFLRRSDVFSFGVIMWAIFAQAEPYHGATPEDLIRDLKENPALRPADIPKIHLGYEDVMKRCWHVDATSRPSFAMALAELRGILREEFACDVAEGYAPAGHTPGRAPSIVQTLPASTVAPSGKQDDAGVGSEGSDEGALLEPQGSGGDRGRDSARDTVWLAPTRSYTSSAAPTRVGSAVEPPAADLTKTTRNPPAPPKAPRGQAASGASESAADPMAYASASTVRDEVPAENPVFGASTMATPPAPSSPRPERAPRAKPNARGGGGASDLQSSRETVFGSAPRETSPTSARDTTYQGAPGLGAPARPPRAKRAAGAP